jgi:hypothetical protein
MFDEEKDQHKYSIYAVTTGESQADRKEHCRSNEYKLAKQRQEEVAAENDGLQVDLWGWNYRHEWVHLSALVIARASNKYDSKTAYQNATEGIEKAEKKSGPEWMEYALAFFKDVAQRHPVLTADTLWLEGLAEPASKHALGGLWRRARKLGWVKELLSPEGYICCTISSAKNCNGMITRVYKSTLYNGGGNGDHK